MPKTKEDVQEELIEWFGERVTGSKFYEDYGLIGSYLSDSDQYRPALRQLHSEMELLFDARGPGLSGGEILNRPLNMALARIYRDVSPDSKAEFFKKLKERFSKLLSTVLRKNEAKKGFHVGVEDSQVDILVGLSGKLFNWLLKNRRPFKDIGASFEHGENSHRIQWYLISQMTTLTRPVAEIYEKLTGWSTPEKYEPFDRKLYMWEFLVDRDGVPSNVSLPMKTDAQTDFRAPSNVNRCLKNGGLSRDFYLLEACLSHRWAKRKLEGGAFDYYCRKLSREMSSVKEEELRSILMGDKSVIVRAK